MSDCLVIGGGISGLLTTLLLHEAGLKVSLIEQGQLGQESSWAGGGILSPLYPWRAPESITTLARWSQTHYATFAEELRQRSGIDPEYLTSGLLILEVDEYSQARAWADQHSIKLAKLTSTDLPHEALECYEEALWFPEVGQLRNPRLLKALKQALINAQIPILEHHRVTGIQINHHRQVIGVTTQALGLIAGERVVVAAGAWSAPLLKTLHINLAVRPVRGQMILFATQPGLISRIVLAQERYIIPRRDGHILVGSTVEEVGFDKTTTLTALEDLQKAAFSLIPRLVHNPIQKQWAGLRPSSPKGIPYICEHPDFEGLYLNTGHFRNGVVLGLASAHLLVDIMLKRPPILEPSPYSITASRE